MDLKLSLQEKITKIESLILNPNVLQNQKLLELSQDLMNVLDKGSKIAFVGNGGSAAEAMHLAAEFTGKCVKPHRPLDVVCLNESQSALTAIGNDYGQEFVFSRLVEAHLKEGDVLIALSTSGKSANVVRAIEVANKLGVKTLLWMGEFEEDTNASQVWKVPSADTPRIQEVHLMWGHIVAELIEEMLDQ
jgi:D-sedoheptulose 7-phosphate isomerase